MSSKDVVRALKDDILNEALHYTNRFEEGIVKSFKTPMVYIRVLEAYKSSHSRALQEAIINHKEALTTHQLSIIDTSRSLWSNILKATEMKAKNTFVFMSKNRLYGNELWWNLIPKITFNLSVSAPKLGVDIVIDRVDSYPHGGIPSLVKRSEAPESGMWTNHRLELGLCMLALAENGLVVQEGNILYGYGAFERELVMSPELQERILEILQQMKWTLSTSTLPSRLTNLKKCDHCPHKKVCFDDIAMSVKMGSFSGKIYNADSSQTTHDSPL